MKRTTKLITLFFLLVAIGFTNLYAAEKVETTRGAKNVKIQIAILLDTSSSMGGLIEQTKARLWNIVNTMTTLKYNGRTPNIEIALYEYGNNGIKTDDYIRQITTLTADLDYLSEKLFALTTWGGSEYCGAVINKAVGQLEWDDNPSSMKLIYIAGNEPFTQGKISYKTAISKALEKSIYVNTIHCGSESEGVRGMWRDGAIRGKGKFFNIDHNVKIRHYDTPYDDRISDCNRRLNTTYMAYGASGLKRQESQMAQDANALGVSSANMAERAVSKSSKFYDNSSWDIVDMYNKDNSSLKKMKSDDLPKELQNKTQTELQKIIEEKDAERKAIQKEINELAKKRQDYIDEQQKKDNAGQGGDDLGKAINEAIITLANKKGYIVAK